MLTPNEKLDIQLRNKGNQDVNRLLNAVEDLSAENTETRDALCKTVEELAGIVDSLDNLDPHETKDVSDEIKSITKSVHALFNGAEGVFKDVLEETVL